MGSLGSRPCVRVSELKSSGVNDKLVPFYSRSREVFNCLRVNYAPSINRDPSFKEVSKACTFQNCI